MKVSRLIASVLLAALLAVLAACAQLPSQQGRTDSHVLQDTADTRLGRTVQHAAQEHPGQSGIIPLVSGHDAFAARLSLVQSAQRTLDLQYYIWRNDLSGSLLLDAIRAAAARGVRVRLLLDDSNSAGLDPLLRELDADPRIEVRIFNPFAHRDVRIIDYLADFGRVNRRMHNKSLTADNQVTIIGGRNIGDEYFAARGDFLFLDLDVLAIGTVVDEVSRDFDRYWASESAYPLERLAPEGPRAHPLLPNADATAVGAYRGEVARSDFMRELQSRKLPFEWGAVRMISDDPGKVLGRVADADAFWARFRRVVPTPTREVVLVSPYFVPGERGAEFLAHLAHSGVKVSVLTNALEATDVPAVHAGYARWRKPLLAAGVRIYELKRTVPAPASRGSGAGSNAGGPGSGISGSSSSSLHAKVFLLDRERLFVGSLNFDPRSATLNTELGFVIEIPQMASAFTERFDAGVARSAYRLELAGDELRWVEQDGSQEVVHTQEPHAGVLRRLAIRLLGLLPIEDLL